MSITRPTTNDLLAVYTLPVAHNTPSPENNADSGGVVNCPNCRRHASNESNNNSNRNETEENQQFDPNLPSYSDVLNKTPPNYITIL